MEKWFKRLLLFLLFLFVLLNIVVAFHAYKFTHFYDSGRSPVKKIEVMTTSEKMRTILLGADYYKLPAGPAPKGFEVFYLTTKDSLTLEGWYDSVANAKGTVIMFHGHGGNKSGLSSEAEAYKSFGYNVCLIDFRAHGNSSGNVSTIGFYESADVKAAYDYVAAKGEKNIVLHGISLGAAAITKAIADGGVKPSKVILEMPFGSLLDAVKARLKLMGLPRQPLATLLTFWGGIQQRFWAFNHEPSEYAKTIEVPVLLQWGRHDARVSQDETEAIYNNITSKQKKLVVYEQSGHQSLLRNEPDKWLKEVGEFMK